jgi:hypothetical protein
MWIRPQASIHPHPTPLPFDGLFAECESKSAPGMLFSVEAPKRLEDSALKWRVYDGHRIALLDHT